jgi:hypothetical protein
MISEKYFSQRLYLGDEHNNLVKEFIEKHQENFVTNLFFLNCVLEGVAPY